MNTCDRILLVSLKHFITLGFDRASLNSIAQEVGIKKPSIYYHFKSKEELLLKGIEVVIVTLEKEIETVHNPEKPIKDQLLSLFECLLDFNARLSVMIGNEYGTPINLISIFQMANNRFAEVSDLIDGYYNRLNILVSEIITQGQSQGEIREGISSEAVAIDMIARLEGLTALSAVYKAVDINRIRTELYEFFWSSIATHGIMPKKRRFFGYKNLDLGHKW